MKINPKSAEILTKWYLRFNGYFIVENFIIHAADDENRIHKGEVLNYTEVDLLAIRHKYSSEISGIVSIENDVNLIEENEYEIDFIIGETKTGNQDSANKIWKHKNLLAIEYLIRFAGFIEDKNKINLIAKKLLENRNYKDEDLKYKIRLIIFSEINLNKNFTDTKNIKILDIINFMCNRGECWKDKNIGFKSKHSQWDPLINEIIKVTNDQILTTDSKIEKIMSIMCR